MTELERWKDYVAEQLAAHPHAYPQPPGYWALSPRKTITVDTDRPGGGGIYWSFQATLQWHVQGLVAGFTTKGMSDDQVRELLNGDADDAVAWLGNNDPDTENRDALVEEYVQLFRFGVTPI